MKAGIANMTSAAWAVARRQAPPPSPAPAARPKAAPQPKPQQPKRDRGGDGRFAINDGGKKFR